MAAFDSLRDAFMNEIVAVGSEKDLEAVNIKYLGRKGLLADSARAWISAP